MTIGTISIIAGVALLILLKLFLKDEESPDENKGLYGVGRNELFEEEPEVDPSWSVLPGNVWHSDET